MNFLESTLNFLFDEKCDICNKYSKESICIDCLFSLSTIEVNKIEKHIDTEFDEHFWMFKYDGEIRDLIIKYKFGDCSYLYRTFSSIILNDVKAMEYINSFDYILPVPIHKKRLKQRGYNQCSLIAKEISKHTDSVIYVDNLLKKIKHNDYQSTTSGEDRSNNVKGVYELDKRNIEKYNFNNKRILIFDDVFTTGSTANECAKVIKQLGNVSVGVFTIAKD